MKKPLVIAHRGASGYLPEHTLAAKALAYGMGADYLEQDVVASRDNQLIVMHDVLLDDVSDVAQKYPDRGRADGHFYVRDFDLVELRTLNLYERFEGTANSPVFPQRFPPATGHFGIVTLRDELEMITGLNRSTGRSVGIYPEIKRPAWHHEHGIDLAAGVLTMLAEYGYKRNSDPVFLQCFDAQELQRIRDELGCELKLIQLIGDNSWGEAATDYDQLLSKDGLKKVAAYADGIGPWIMQLYRFNEAQATKASTGLVAAAHESALAVHPYTFRADQLAPGFSSMTEMVSWFLTNEDIDGFFTDFPDKGVAIVNLLQQKNVI
jgi:glycerophosphoryl diester phosphodiesterase